MNIAAEAEAAAAARAAGNGQHGTGPQPRHGHQQPPHPSPLHAILTAHDALNGNPLITAILTHPGMGQRLSDRDIDAVMRVIASIEAAHIEAPGRAQDGQQ